MDVEFLNLLEDGYTIYNFSNTRKYVYNENKNMFYEYEIINTITNKKALNKDIDIEKMLEIITKFKDDNKLIFISDYVIIYDETGKIIKAEVPISRINLYKKLHTSYYERIIQ